MTIKAIETSYYRPWWLQGEIPTGDGWLDPVLDSDTNGSQYTAYVAARSARF